MAVSRVLGFTEPFLPSSLGRNYLRKRVHQIFSMRVGTTPISKGRSLRVSFEPWQAVMRARCCGRPGRVTSHLFKSDRYWFPWLFVPTFLGLQRAMCAREWGRGKWTDTHIHTQTNTRMRTCIYKHKDKPKTKTQRWKHRYRDSWRTQRDEAGGGWRGRRKRWRIIFDLV